MGQVQPQIAIRNIRQRYNVTAQDVAKMADVPLRILYLMEIGCPVSQVEASKVLRALSRLTNDHSVVESRPQTESRPL